MINMWEEFNRQAVLLAPKLYSGLLIFIAFWGLGIISAKMTNVIGKSVHVHKDIMILLRPHF